MQTCQLLFLNTTNFAVGDVIVIEQDMVEWSYTDNQFVSGDLSLIGTTKHDFRVGQGDNHYRPDNASSIQWGYNH